MKGAIRAAMRLEPVPASLRRRVGRRSYSWIAAAAAIVVAIALGSALLIHRDNPGAELADMHVTMLASANPVDVISTDRHTVKPWFEGRVPFAVPVPDVAAPFRLLGGRVVYWRGNPAAYLLFGKDAHRISVFVMREGPSAIMPVSGHSIISWHSNGLTFVAVGEVPREDLSRLSIAFTNIDDPKGVH
jgi:anti-sigma factor RsiW